VKRNHTKGHKVSKISFKKSLCCMSINWDGAKNNFLWIRCSISGLKRRLTKAVMPYCALAIVTHRMDGMIKPLSRELITKHIKHYEQQKNREVNSHNLQHLKLFLFLCFLPFFSECNLRREAFIFIIKTR